MQTSVVLEKVSKESLSSKVLELFMRTGNEIEIDDFDRESNPL